MRITDLKPMAIKIPQEDTFGGKGAPEKGEEPSETTYFLQPGWRGLYSDQTETTLVKVETDEGIVGFGEGQAPIGPEVTAMVIDKVLRPILIGRDPTQIGVLRHEMYEAMNIRGHYTGFMVNGISAVDSALWDIKGKKLGAPVVDLLGGAFRDRVPVYVSGIRGRTIEEQAATAQGHVKQGFRALKMFLGFNIEEDLEHIRAVREAVGPDVQLMVDTLWGYDVPTAIQFGRHLERHRIAWFETPTSPEDLEGHAEIARTLEIPVAAGETELTSYQFLRWFQARALDIAQPDVGRCGITETKRIADLAELFNIPVALHAGICLAPSIAASIHVAAATPKLLFQEYQPVMLEVSNRFLKHPMVCEEGHFHLPEGPGLGIEINEEALAQYVTG